MSRDPCHHLTPDRRCAKRLHGRRRIGPGVCARCAAWEAIDPANPLTVNGLAPGEVRVCPGRRNEFPAAAWLTLLDGVIRFEASGKMIVTRGAWDAALSRTRNERAAVSAPPDLGFLRTHKKRAQADQWT